MAFIEVDAGINTAHIEQELYDAIDNATMLEIHNLLAKMCDPYVPFLEGPLSQTVEVTAHWARYIQPYARYQYYGTNFNHTVDYHPLASAMWDKAMMRDHGDEFKAQVRQILKERLQNG